MRAFFYFQLTILGAGLGWKILRFALNTARWVLIGQATTLVLKWVLIPELELAQLVASFAIWVYQVVTHYRAYVNAVGKVPINFGALDSVISTFKSNVLLVDNKPTIQMRA